jgi:hypothetical protein
MTLVWVIMPMCIAGVITLTEHESWAKLATDRPVHKDEPLRYGLRFFCGDQEVRLWQISGSGRLRLRNIATEKIWWAPHPLKRVQWEICRTNDGQTFSDRTTAQEVATRLSTEIWPTRISQRS